MSVTIQPPKPRLKEPGLASAGDFGRREQPSCRTCAGCWSQGVKPGERCLHRSWL